jgi:hypothetical protein
LYTEGVIGKALKFTNNQETYASYPHKDNLDAANLLENQTGCTFSWWMFPLEKLDTISGETRRDIISKGVGFDDINDQDWAIYVRHDSLVFEGRSLQRGWTVAGTSIASWVSHSWYYVTMCYNGKTVQWFINGEPSGPAVDFDYSFVTSNDKIDIIIGRHYLMPPNEIFDGILDEIRIENLTRSAAWVKLSYLNQKASNSLLMIK